jgi:hypothetical protein
MKLTRAIFAVAVIIAPLGCASPEPTPRYGPFFDGYAVKDEVEPASFPDTFTPDTLLPGEERIEVLEVPAKPADTEPPRNLDEEPVPDEPLPYHGWDLRGYRGRPRARR